MVVQPIIQRSTKHNDSAFTWSAYSEKDTGLKFISVLDEDTGVTVGTPLANPNVRTAAFKAWAGARHSRAPGTAPEIMNEMGMKGVDPDQKLDETFSTYGHASVADMARIDVHIDNCPMHFPFMLFNLGEINSGQEKSTRYQQKFGKSVLHGLKNYLPPGLDSKAAEELEREYDALGDLSLSLFGEFKEKVTKAYTEFYKPDPTNKGHSGALASRVLDTVRFFLLTGQNTSFDFETSARDWARKIGDLRSSPISFYGRMADQLEYLLSPPAQIIKDGSGKVVKRICDLEDALGFKAEAPSLVRHTEANDLVKRNLETLSLFLRDETDFYKSVQLNRTFKGFEKQSVSIIPKEFSAAERMVAQYAIAINPGTDAEAVLKWVHNNPSELKKKISKIIFNGHNKYDEMSQMARTTDLSLIINASLGEQRDFNRQRGYGRFVQHFPYVLGLPVTSSNADQILANGYGLSMYLTDVPAFAELRKDFEGGVNRLYDAIGAFQNKAKKILGYGTDYEFIVNILPLAHKSNMFMHGDPKQASYMPDLRVRPGGLINYRDIAWQSNDLFSEYDPYLSGLKLSLPRPDPASRTEFLDRS